MAKQEDSFLPVTVYINGKPQDHGAGLVGLGFIER